MCLLGLGLAAVVLLLYAAFCIYVLVFREFLRIVICQFGFVTVLRNRFLGLSLVVEVEIVLAALGPVVGLVCTCWVLVFLV